MQLTCFVFDDIIRCLTGIRPSISPIMSVPCFVRTVARGFDVGSKLFRPAVLCSCKDTVTRWVSRIFDCF